MEWKQLEQFIVAAKEENMSRAAMKLHISQPSLSQTIKRLEEEMGFPLFVREGKHIRLNESGKILMQTAGQILQMMEDTKRRLEEQNGIPHPEVSIHIGCASTLLPELLRYLRKNDPNLQLRIHQWNRLEKEREDDIQILAGKQGELWEGSKEILLEEEILLALPMGHPLLEKEQIFWKDLEQEEFISLNQNWELARVITGTMEEHQFFPKVTMGVDNPNLMRELLKAHMGIAFVPAVTWHAFAGREVLMRPVASCTMTRRIYLCTKQERYQTKEEVQCM